ncbi:MAG: hypothetical protein JKX94_06315, partial [Sneathiella sp.]|nr:hypothetical protein [Sneathiella sp.]
MSESNKPAEGDLKQDLENLAFGETAVKPLISDNGDENTGIIHPDESDRSLANIHTGNRSNYDESADTIRNAGDFLNTDSSKTQESDSANQREEFQSELPLEAINVDISLEPSATVEDNPLPQASVGEQADFQFLESLVPATEINPQDQEQEEITPSVEPVAVASGASRTSDEFTQNDDVSTPSVDEDVVANSDDDDDDGSLDVSDDEGSDDTVDADIEGGNDDTSVIEKTFEPTVEE